MRGKANGCGRELTRTRRPGRLATSCVSNTRNAPHPGVCLYRVTAVVDMHSSQAHTRQPPRTLTLPSITTTTATWPDLGDCSLRKYDVADAASQLGGQISPAGGGGGISRCSYSLRLACPWSRPSLYHSHGTPWFIAKPMQVCITEETRASFIPVVAPCLGIGESCIRAYQ